MFLHQDDYRTAEPFVKQRVAYLVIAATASQRSEIDNQ